MRTVWVTFTDALLHQWADAPPKRAYLAHPHRHLFHIEVEVALVPTLDPNARALEFHDLLVMARQAWDLVVLNHTEASGRSGSIENVGGLSCEKLAQLVGEQLLCYDEVHETGTEVRVTVSEDGECGATWSEEV